MDGMSKMDVEQLGRQVWRTLLTPRICGLTVIAGPVVGVAQASPVEGKRPGLNDGRG